MREQHSMNLVTWWEVYDSEGRNVGHIHNTYHPTLQYEAFYVGLNHPSHRTNSLDDAEAWILAKAHGGND